MATSKCANCNAQLKSGEWMLQRRSDGTVVKVCNDKNSCYKRMRYKSFHICKE